MLDKKIKTIKGKFYCNWNPKSKEAQEFSNTDLHNYINMIEDLYQTAKESIEKQSIPSKCQDCNHSSCYCGCCTQVNIRWLKSILSIADGSNE